MLGRLRWSNSLVPALAVVCGVNKCRRQLVVGICTPSPLTPMRSQREINLLLNISWQDPVQTPISSVAAFETLFLTNFESAEWYILELRGNHSSSSSICRKGSLILLLLIPSFQVAYSHELKTHRSFYVLPAEISPSTRAKPSYH